MNKKIFHITRRFSKSEWGGTETVILETAKAQKAMGFEPVILTTTALDDKRDDEIDKIPIKRFSYIYPWFGLTKDDKVALDKKGGNLLSFPMLYYLLIQNSPLIYHLHTSNRIGAAARFAAKIKGVPYVVSLHGGLSNIPVAEMDSLLKPIQHKIEWGKAAGFLLGSRKVIKEANAIICVGRDEWEENSKIYGEKKVFYQPNGVDCKKFINGKGMDFREKFKIGKDAKLILCVSRIDHQKNQKMLVELLPQLKKRNANVFLALIGPPTNPKYYSDIENMISAKNLDASVLIRKGFPPDSPDLVNAFCAADVFVLPTIHEPFGIVILEAWAAHKPVAASRIGGIPFFVDDNVNGLLFNPQKPDEAVDKIISLINDEKLASSIGEAGFKKAKEMFSWESLSEKLLSIYKTAGAKL